MPRLKNIKPPTQKRVDGAIYSFEKRDEHNKAVALVEKCKKYIIELHRPVKILSFDRLGNTVVKVVYPTR